MPLKPCVADPAPRVQFAKADGTTDWDAVIDAEMERRKLLEESPLPSRNDDPVNFDTSMIPWWAWVKRFHLPEAEKLNGRAAMVGYLLAGLVELASGAGLVEQQVRLARGASAVLGGDSAIGCLERMLAHAAPRAGDCDRTMLHARLCTAAQHCRLARQSRNTSLR